MLTLHDISARLGPDRAAANETRARASLEQSPDASFYEYRISKIAPPSVSWSNHPGADELEVHVYERVADQSTEFSCFLCSHRTCDAKDLPTAALGDDGMVKSACVFCETERPKTKRRRTEARR